MENTMCLILLLIYMIVLSFFDFKYKKVPCILLIAGSLAAFGNFGYQVLLHEQNWRIYAGGLLPGIFFLVFSVLTQKIGRGDGWLLLIVGAVLGYRRCTVLFLASLIIISVVSLVLMGLHRVKRNTAIPYIPFLTLTVFVYTTLIQIRF